MPSTSDMFAQALQWARSSTQKKPTQALEDFDPTQNLKTYGAAAAGDFDKTLKRSVSDLQGSAVGAGRLNTGFYDQDQGRLVTDLAGQYQRDLASHAMEASGQKLRATESAASMNEEEQNRYLELLAGGMDREQAAANAKQQSQESLYGALGEVAGAALPLVLASSERYKDDIEPLEGASDKLGRVRGKRFNWKDDGSEDVGVIAEDVADAVPEAAVRDGGGRAAAVDYGRLMPVMIEAINEQGDELAKLRNALGQRRAA